MLEQVPFLRPCEDEDSDEDEDADGPPAEPPRQHKKQRVKASLPPPPSQILGRCPRSGCPKTGPDPPPLSQLPPKPLLPEVEDEDDDDDSEDALNEFDFLGSGENGDGRRAGEGGGELGEQVLGGGAKRQGGPPAVPPRCLPKVALTPLSPQRAAGCGCRGCWPTCGTWTGSPQKRPPRGSPARTRVPSPSPSVSPSPLVAPPNVPEPPLVPPRRVPRPLLRRLHHGQHWRRRRQPGGPGRPDGHQRQRAQLRRESPNCGPKPGPVFPCSVPKTSPEHPLSPVLPRMFPDAALSVPLALLLLLSSLNPFVRVPSVFLRPAVAPKRPPLSPECPLGSPLLPPQPPQRRFGVEKNPNLGPGGAAVLSAHPVPLSVVPVSPPRSSRRAGTP